MKHAVLFLLGLATTISTLAQTDGSSAPDPFSSPDPAAIADSIFRHAEATYNSYFLAKGENDAPPQTAMYDTLLACFYEYMMCLNDMDDATQAAQKTKIRKMHSEFEDAAICYSGSGDNAKAYRFLKCFLIIIPRLPMFRGEALSNGGANYPNYLSFSCVEAYNAREYEESEEYARQYIELGEKNAQELCYKVLVRDLDSLNKSSDELRVLDEALMNYPNNMELIASAINLNHRMGNNDKVGELLEKALTLSPDDEELLFFRANLYCDEGQYDKALPTYESLHGKHPGVEAFTHQLALCYYGMAATRINESNKVEGDVEKFKALNDQATECFNKAIPLLERLTQGETAADTDKKLMLTALAESYKFVGRTDDSKRVARMAEATSMALGSSKSKEEIPNFNDWYRPRLDKVLKSWEQRGEFESAADYQKRVNVDNRRTLASDTKQNLEKDFIAEYSHLYNLTDLTIKPYDPDHQTYRIQTRQGDIYLSVPLANDEARQFKEEWNGVEITSPQFKINSDGKLLLATARFRTPKGATYTYDANLPLEYGEIKIAKPQWNDDELFAEADTGQDTNEAETESYTDDPIIVGESSVDVNLPKAKRNTNTNTFALIIANENYRRVSPVPFANNDGASFRKYCVQVFGIPEENIVFVKDAGLTDMIDAIDDIKQKEAAYSDLNLLVYYSGHGVPDGDSHEQYLLPVDARPENLSTAYKLSKFYAELSSGKPNAITVFIDACFSGAKKDGTIMDMAARGAVVKAKQEAPTNNMVIFSACSGTETAYPYINEKHGLFTFYLLKKLQEDKGKSTYKALADYISTNVKQQSNKQYRKLQSPTVQSLMPESEWGKKRLDKE